MLDAVGLQVFKVLVISKFFGQVLGSSLCGFRLDRLVDL
jgi:hypothetical protein